jgi:hypothetical protein
MSTTETDEQFERYRNYLRNEIGRLADYVALYRRIDERKTDYLAEINYAPAFFSVVTDALFSAIIIWTDKLFDENGQRGIFDFLKFVENNVCMFSIEQLKSRRNYPDNHWVLDRKRVEGKITIEKVKKDREMLKALGCLKSFRIRRDKFHAHFDREFFFDRKRLTDDAPITWADLEEVVKVLSEVVNKYSSAYDAHHFEMTASNISDLDDVLNGLREHRKYLEGNDVK